MIAQISTANALLRVALIPLAALSFAGVLPQRTSASTVLPASRSSLDVDFQRDVLPVLEKHCLACHGAEEQESDLRLDQRASLLKGGFSGEPAIVPGDAAASLMMKLIGDGVDGLYMPPESDPLPEKDQAILREWIDSGANIPDGHNSEGNAEESDRAVSSHWSLRPVERPEVPATIFPESHNPIDQFIGERLKEEELSFSPEADRLTQIRRLFLVLLGVPPTPHEVDRFLQDDDPQAYEHLVDQLLADPRYGERWASHWLDIARFGETDGFETNRERPNAYHYRDYVIEAFNDDLPYDDFVKQQIAGDVFGAPIGTGFLVAGPYDIVKSPDKKLTLMQRQDELTDVVNTTGTAFLGLTLGCARCHNHKFDPISQKDFYAIEAIFAGVNHGEATLPPGDDKLDRRQQLADRISSLKSQLTSHVVAPAGPLLIPPTPATHPLDRGTVEWYPAHETAELAAGDGPGQQDDPGSLQRMGNISRGYRWWTNQPGEAIVGYQPQTRGRYRIWLSWGSGWKTHSSDVEYVLDRDGDLKTLEDQQILAKVDQRLLANHQSATQAGFSVDAIPDQSLWSGFQFMGAHELEPTSLIVLRGGATGEAVTADWLLLEPQLGSDAGAAILDVDSASLLPPYRQPVNAKRNVEHFQPRRANAVRLTIQQTTSGSEPCIDEFEIWSGDQNVALAAWGTTVNVSGTLPGYAIHQTEHIHDGQHGNDHSWISNKPNTGSVEFQFPKTVEIDRIVWGRDRNGQFADRVPTDYRIEVATAQGDWEVIVDSNDRLRSDQLQPTRVVFGHRNASPTAEAKLDQLVENLMAYTAEYEALSQPRPVYAGNFTKPAPTYRLYRGDPMTPREEVPPETLEILTSLKLPANASDRDRRAEFAKSIASLEHPLTSRVIVNRLWQHTFGRGIVATPSDFGRNGIPPTHPELINWMAYELMHPTGPSFADDADEATRWSLKRLHRLLVCSHTFRQSSQPTDQGLAKDAGTTLWWRFPSRRLTAESIRDSMLKVSGTLRSEMGGPGFSAFEIEFENVRHYFPKENYTSDDFRRMVYMTKVRQEKDAVFGVFDCPDGSQVQPNRSRSTTPRQALNLFNSSFTLQQAQHFADAILRDVSDPQDGAEFVTVAYRRTYGRRPTAMEISDAQEFMASLGEPQGRIQFCRALLNSNEFLFIP